MGFQPTGGSGIIRLDKDKMFDIVEPCKSPANAIMG